MKDNKDWRRIVEDLDVDYTENTPDTGLVDTIYHINDAQMDYIVEQIISERDKEIVEIITQHYIPGHMVVNPTLEAIITKITNTK